MFVSRAIIVVLATLTLAACGKENSWVAQIGGLNAESVFGITATDDGRACITGTFISTVEFGNETRPNMLDSGGYSDIFVSCYESDGQPAFATHFGVTQKNDQPRAIAAMPGGDVLVTGFFSDTFGKEPGQILQAPGRSNANVFLARLDNTGATVWARSYGGLQTDNGRALAVDADGNILLAGAFQGLLPYTEDGVGHKMASAGLRDAFLLKLNPDGDIIWGRRFGGAKSDEAFAVTTTSSGTIVVAGTFAGAASADDGPAVEAVGYNDVFLQAWSPDGEMMWTRSFGGGGQEYIGGLAATDDGSVWIAGSFQREIAFANGETLISQGSTDGFLVNLDADGNINRPLSFGSKDVELVYGISLAADGSILLTGHFQNEADLAPGPEKSIYPASGVNDTDGFVLSLDRNGKHQGAILFAGDDVAIGSGVTTMADGGMAVTGIFGKKMQVKGTGDFALTSRGKSDVFVLRTSAN